jgi:hypothetical protein
VLELPNGETLFYAAKAAKARCTPVNRRVSDYGYTPFTTPRWFREASYTDIPDRFYRSRTPEQTRHRLSPAMGSISASPAARKRRIPARTGEKDYSPTTFLRRPVGVIEKLPYLETLG